MASQVRWCEDDRFLSYLLSLNGMIPAHKIILEAAARNKGLKFRPLLPVVQSSNMLIPPVNKVPSFLIAQFPFQSIHLAESISFW